MGHGCAVLLCLPQKFLLPLLSKKKSCCLLDPEELHQWPPVQIPGKAPSVLTFDPTLLWRAPKTSGVGSGLQLVICQVGQQLKVAFSERICVESARTWALACGLWVVSIVWTLKKGLWAIVHWTRYVTFSSPNTMPVCKVLPAFFR